MENLINENHISIDEEKANSQEVKSFFCLNWKTTKAGLEIMHSLVKNFIVRIVIKGLISVGDVIHASVCEEE